MKTIIWTAALWSNHSYRYFSDRFNLSSDELRYDSCSFFPAPFSDDLNHLWNIVSMSLVKVQNEINKYCTHLITWVSIENFSHMDFSSQQSRKFWYISNRNKQTNTLHWFFLKDTQSIPTIIWFFFVSNLNCLHWLPHEIAKKQVIEKSRYEIMCKWRIEDNTTFLLNLKKKKQSLNDAKMQPVFYIWTFESKKKLFSIYILCRIFKTEKQKHTTILRKSFPRIVIPDTYLIHYINRSQNAFVLDKTWKKERREICSELLIFGCCYMHVPVDCYWVMHYVCWLMK